MLTPRPENFPLELVLSPQWVVWKRIMRDGKPVKLPVSARTGRAAKTNDPSTWADFGEAYSTWKGGGYSGLGYMMGIVDNPLLVIDIDEAFHEGELTEHALIAVNMLESYTEVSASGRGLHIFCKANKPTEECRKGGIEVYSRLRFIAVTGVRLNDYGIEKRQGQIDGLWKHWFPQPEVPMFRGASTVAEEEDDALIARACQHPQFAQLWQGFAGDDHSKADLSLCNHLAYYTNNDPLRMDTLFRKSGLMRKKWDDRRGSTTYGAITIRKALER